MLSVPHLIRRTGWSVLLLVSLAFSGPAFALAGKFQFVNGEVRVVDVAGQTHAAKKGDEVNAGDAVVTAMSGYAQIRMEDGGLISVRPDTKFKIDAFEFNGKEDGTEKSFFSLVKGSLRSVTGLVGKLHHDNYQIKTATATIGIRGSGADVGHEDAVGTAVHTLFGAHSISSVVNGKTFTLETRPGQTALVTPGGVPQYVPAFPFSTVNSAPGGKSGSKENGDKGKDDKSDNGKNGSGSKSAPRDASTVDNTLTNSTASTTTTSTGTTASNPINLTPPPIIPIISSTGVVNFTAPAPAPAPFVLPAGNWLHEIDSLIAYGGGFANITSGTSGKFFGNGSNLVFDAAGNLFSHTKAGADLDVDTATNIPHGTVDVYTISGGTPADYYAAPDRSIYFGRWQGGTLTLTNCVLSAACPASSPIIDALWAVAQAPAPAYVNTLTGTVNYTLASATQPFNALGNLGKVNSAFITANFTNQTASYGVNLSIVGMTLAAQAANIAIVKHGADASTWSGNLSVTCTGSCISSQYAGDLGIVFTGSAAATAGMQYKFVPSANTSGPFTDFIQGLAAFTASSTPLANPSVAGIIGGGGVGASILNSALTNDFNIEDQVKFAARFSDATYTQLVAWSRIGSNGPDFSFALGAATNQNLGSDPTLGVSWGRWSGNYIANMQSSNSLNQSLVPTGGFHWMTASHITTASELAALPGLGITTASYSILGGNTNPTTETGAAGTLSSASAAVNFTSQTITSYNIAGVNSGSGLGNWSASGSGSIASFMGSSGIPLSGSGGGIGGGICISACSFTGTAKGGFVGTQAQGMISSYTLSTGGTGASMAVGTVYLKR